jgi:DNA-binding NtrC family response regulator
MEDNPAIAQEMAECVAAAGYHCRTAEGVRIAAGMIEHRPPSIVVADYQVADGTALDLLRRLRRPEYARIPVILATAAASTARSAIRDFPQVKAVLQKPVPVAELTETIARFARAQTTAASCPRLVSREERQRLLSVVQHTSATAPENVEAQT